VLHPRRRHGTPPPLSRACDTWTTSRLLSTLSAYGHDDEIAFSRHCRRFCLLLLCLRLDFVSPSRVYRMSLTSHVNAAAVPPPPNTCSSYLSYTPSFRTTAVKQLPSLTSSARSRRSRRTNSSAPPRVPRYSAFCTISLWNFNKHHRLQHLKLSGRWTS